MALVTLSIDEIEHAREIGRARHDHKWSWPVDWNEGKKTPRDVASEGAVCEMAYAKFWGLDIDRDLFERGKGDNGVDLQFPGGVTVDVKGSLDYTSGNLILTKLPPAPYLRLPHYYALCFKTDAPTIFSLAGIVSAAEFFCRATIDDFGFGKRFKMHQSLLRPPEGLRAITNLRPLA